MTIEDAKVIGLGSIALLLFFVGVQAIRFDAWAIIRRYFIVRVVNHYEDAAPVVMSRSSEEVAPLPLSSKDGQSDGRTDSDQVGRTELLTLYKVLRKYGIPREEIRPALKGVRVPLSNDVWAAAQAEEQAHVTPIVGRPTSARFETDADYPYQAPAH